MTVKYFRTDELADEPAIMDINYETFYGVEYDVQKNAILKNHKDFYTYIRIISELRKIAEEKFLLRLDYIWIYQGIKVISIKMNGNSGRSAVVDVNELNTSMEKKQKSWKEYFRKMINF